MDTHIRYYIDPLYWWETIEYVCDCEIGKDHG